MAARARRSGMDSARCTYTDSNLTKGEKMKTNHYGIVISAPGCYGDTTTVQRVSAAGTRIRLTRRQALHRIDGLSTEPYAWTRGQRVTGRMDRPDAIGPNTVTV